MNNLAEKNDTAATSRSPHQHLAALLDSQRPQSLLCVSMNPVPFLQQWCDEHDCTLTEIAELNPFSALANTERFDLVIVADQLEYMSHHHGEELLGLVRNLHSNAMLVLYQPAIAPQKLRWALADFLGMGLRKQATFNDDNRQMSLYSYDLDNYNFTRSWNNARFWANPENWGKYWW